MSVRLDRVLARRTLLLALLLLWPLILVGRPDYIADSGSYLKGGKVAVEFVASKLHRSALPPAPTTARPPDAGAGDAPAASTALEEAPKGARSVAYSVVAYLLRWPGIEMTMLALVQIACAAFIGAVAFSGAGLTGRQYLAASAILAFATPLAPVCASIVPDIFSGFVIAAIVLMVLFLDRMSAGVRLALAALIAFSITTHASVPPLAAGMALLGAAVLLVRQRLGLPRVRWAWAWLAGSLAAGMIANTAIGYVAFGEVSVAAKRFPTALTRSVVDGPARWYLEKHCTTEHYAVCEVFGTRIPSTINDFLFYEWGLNGRATPEQMDRIRAEEAEIVMKAALEYPGYEAYNLSRNIARQLFRFDLGKSRFKERLALDSQGVPELVPSGVNIQPVMILAGRLNMILLALCLGWAVWRYRRIDSRERAAIFLVIAGLFGNAVIVVAFSSLASRYQARVVWVLPLFVLGMAIAHFSGKASSGVHGDESG